MAGSKKLAPAMTFWPTTITVVSAQGNGFLKADLILYSSCKSSYATH